VKVASFDTRYRLTVPPGWYDVRDAAGRDYTVSSAMEWVRFHTARTVAAALVRAHPGLPFAIEVCDAKGHARIGWRAIWWSPAAERRRASLWGRLREWAEDFWWSTMHAGRRAGAGQRHNRGVHDGND
jgi:hypothetical protein